MTTIDHAPLVLHPGDRAVQAKVRLPLPIVVGNRDYRERESLLRRMNDILVASGVEAEFLDRALLHDRAVHEQKSRPLTDRHRDAVQTWARQALRCTLARILSNESHRQFSAHLAESPLLQWFCGFESLAEVRVPAKSSLQRMEASVPRDLLNQMNALLLKRSTSVDATGVSLLGLAAPVDLSVVWMDTTCAPLDIHYPSDWSLLRDGTRSLMGTIQVIRSHGLKVRMPDPKSFVSTMNRHAMSMSGASRRGRGGDKKKARKAVLRSMKRVVAKVLRHARSYHAVLTSDWSTTDLSRAQAHQLLNRLQTLIELMPTAVKQAHERIIGERVVANANKLLSLYQPHALVYVRGKAGADAEFGLQLLLGESAEGLIVDCTLTDDRIAHDSTLLIPALKRIRAAHGDAAATGIVTDRGFSSADNSRILRDLGIHDATLPRSPSAMEKALQNDAFRAMHQRRAQTEARIGIFKANFLGDCLPTKSRKGQHRYVAWATLAHNLWVLARLEAIPISVIQLDAA